MPGSYPNCEDELFDECVTEWPLPDDITHVGLFNTADAQQVGGDHYAGLEVQPWAAMQAWLTEEQFSGFLIGNAIKYLARQKGDAAKKVEDVKKARHYLDKWIEINEAG